MNHGSALTTSFEASKGITTETKFPPRHDQLAFAIQLRQLHGRDDAAFNRVSGLLMRLANQAQDSRRDERVRALKAWGRTRSEMLKLSLQDRLEGVALAVDADLDMVPKWKLKGPSPEEMIKLFFYGDRIHWGAHREEYEKLHAEPNKANEYEFQYLVASGQVAMFYMGYAWLIEEMVPAARL